MSTTETKLQHTSDTIKTFTLESLQTITNNFSEEHKIGGGGYGNVYKGMLDNGEEIALKKLHYMPGLDDKVLINEFNNLMKARHKNITRVLCIEYLQNGSLDKYLSEETCGLDWHIRYKIINGVCEGLNYLHNGYKDPIYHMDLKPTNILLDKDMTPKIGDFGLSRLFPPEHTFFTQKMIGTPGYMPPEYIEKHEITSKFDVFSLGVIIIRIIAGDEGYSKCANISSEEFVEHVHENWRKRLGKRMSSHTSEEVITCLKIALKCVEVDRVRRPTISEIIIELNKVDTIKSSTISVEMLDVNAGVQLTRTSNTNELPAMNAIMGAVLVGGDNSHGNSLPIGQLANEIVVEVPATNSKSDARSADGGVAGNFNLTNLGPSVALFVVTNAASPWDEEENRLQQMPKKTSMEASSLSYSNLQTRARPRLGYDFLAKIIIIGESCVGKSQLLSRFAGGSFTTSFITTIGIDFRIRTIELDEKWIKLQVWDTSGHERFRTVTNTYYSGAMGILLVYDVTDESSFNNIRNWKRDIEQHAAPDVTQILVGNKAEMDETKRAVTTSRGQVLADEYGIKFFETSAKTGLNIDQVFISLAREIIQRLAAKTDGIPKDPVAEIKRRHRGPLAFARELFSKKKEG